MALTDTAIRNLKPGERPYKKADGGGLFLLVDPKGSKLWRQAYRFGGKQKLLSHGAYPTVKLSQAREKRDAAKALLARGIDPSADRKVTTARRAVETANTVKLIGEEFFKKCEAEGQSPKTLDRTRRLLEYAYAELASRPIADVAAPELLAVLRVIEGRGTHETAHRLRVLFGQLFRYAIATGRATRDTSADLRGALIVAPIRNRAAIIDPAKIGALLRAIDGYDGQPTTRAALQLSALLFLRPGELRQGKWDEVGLDTAMWVVPASRMKMKREHRVPLSTQALAIFRDLKSHTGNRELIFPAIGNPKRPLSENTLNAALRRLGFTSDEMSAHGFRAMASSRLNESVQWSPDAIERALAHQEQNEVRRAYARGEHWDERVRMMQWWADYLDDLRTDVVPKKARRK